MPPAALRLLLGTSSEPGFFQPAPLLPPVDWFSDAALDAAPARFTVYPDGSCAGVVAPAGRCLLDGTGECWTVPRPADGRGSTLTGSPRDDYIVANLGSTACSDGTLVATGVLAGAGGHAPRSSRLRALGVPAAQVGLAAGDFYADTDHQMARVRYGWSDVAGDGVGGIVAVGALWPEVDDRGVASILASATSIDYRWLPDEAQYRLVGSCLVNIGGLPTRYVAALDSGEGLAFTEAWRPDADVPDRFVASLGLALPRGAALLGFSEARRHVASAPPIGAGSTVSPMRRPVRHCTTCPPVDRTAAYRAVTPAGPAWFAEVTYSGGVGAFCDVLLGPDGGELWVIHPVVDNMIDESERVAVAAQDATLTGRRFEWVFVDDVAVVDADVPVDGESYLAAADSGDPMPGDPVAALATSVADLTSQVASLAATVSAMQEQMVNAALADEAGAPVSA